jgi:hypothetical protein
MPVTIALSLPLQAELLVAALAAVSVARNFCTHHLTHAFDILLIAEGATLFLQFSMVSYPADSITKWLDVDTVEGSLFESANLACQLVNLSSRLHDLNRNEDIHPRRKFE